MSLSPTPHGRRLLLERYQIRGKLGSGNLGAVYRAWDQAEERLVALKVLRTEQLIADALPRVQEEFRAVASLRHPQIARVYDFGFTDEGRVPFFTREYIDGKPLPPGPPGDEEPVAFLKPVLDLLEALEYVHQQGILHLDIHAGNLIVASDSRRGSVLIDFGLAGSLDTPLFGTSAETWPAIPPEMLERCRPAVPSDIFLVGRLLLYRLTGQTGGQPTLPREIPGWGTRLTLDLERIATKALRKAPGERFASAAEFRETLARALGQPRHGIHRAEPQQLLIGRDREIALVDRCLRSVVDGSCEVLTFVARAGLGKSRLLSEARLHSQLRGLHTVSVCFASVEDPQPALTVALRKLRGCRGSLSWLEPLAPKFGGTPAQRAQRAASAYFTSRETPLVLVLDDVDRADQASRLLVEALVQECQRRHKEGQSGRGLAVIMSVRSALTEHADWVNAHTLEPLASHAAEKLFESVLRPLSVHEQVAHEALNRARGSPLRLRQLAVALREQWSHCRTIPASAELPPSLPGTPGTGIEEWQSLSATERELMKVLAVCDRPVTVEELEAATGYSRALILKSMTRLMDFEVVTTQGSGQRRHRVPSNDVMEQILATVKPSESREIHESLASYLDGLESPELTDRESLAGHFLALGRQAPGARLALATARELRQKGGYDRAVELLQAALEHETVLKRRLEIIEEISALLVEVGDDRRGVEFLEPLFRSGPERSRLERVRLGRCLGIHSHRAGLSAQAREVFETTMKLAEATRDRVDLICIDSELAELHIFEGKYDAARDVCKRGLERLADFSGAEDFRGRMEVMLRASLGHIDLRKLRLDAAREELLRASRGSKHHGTIADRAAILHNLGVLESQANRFGPAERYFAEAERLLARAGERQNLIKISTNLALIEAKLGKRGNALGHLERAAGLLSQHSGARLECFVAYSRAVVFLLLGQCEEAIEAFRSAIPLAHRLRDRPLKRFAEINLAEACLFVGRYRAALPLLKRDAASQDDALDPVFDRMTLARLYFAESVLGRSRAGKKALQRLERTPRTDIVYLEAWNDFFVAVGHLASGHECDALLQEVQRTFRELGIVYGARFAQLGLLVRALLENGDNPLRARATDLVSLGTTEQRFLAVAEPVALAAAFLRLGETERAGENLAAAASSIVGSPFLEVDWELEFLRACLAQRQGDLREARRHLHRSLHCRDLLTQSVPARWKERFLSHRRFDALNDAAARLNIQPVGGESTEQLRRACGYQGLVGQSATMAALFQTIERLREQDVTVLLAGETGSGKDLVARALHRSSIRRDRALRIIACACLPNELFESELFGHVAGAFTGAEHDQTGLLEESNGGTAVLEDVDQLSLESQAKLLRVLESGTIRKLGGTSDIRIDVRFVTTTSADLQHLAEQGRFRRDLYYRLGRVELRIPPLRERREDIPLLTQHFLEKHAQRLDRGVAKIEPAALELLQAYDWPGNVRELESVLFRLLVTLSRSETIRAEDIEPVLSRDRASLFDREPALLERDLGDWQRDLQRAYLTRLFEAVHGDMNAMMDRLGIKSTKLYDWLRDLDLDIRALRRRLSGEKPGQ